MPTDKELVEQSQRSVEGSARAFTAQLRRWMLRYARAEAHVLINEMRRDGARAFLKVGVSSHETLVKELRELMRAFGLRRISQTARQTGNIVGGTGTKIIVPADNLREFLRGHEPRIQKILEETREATRQSVGDLVRASLEKDTRASIGELARQIKWMFHGDVDSGGRVVGSRPVTGRGILPTDELTTRVSKKPGEEGILYHFGSERAALIAETEMAIADSAGREAGFEVLGVQEVMWLAVTSDRRSGEREHWRMHKKTVRRGEFFVLPDGTQLRHPHDINGIGNVIGNIIRCRCTYRAARRRGG